MFLNMIALLLRKIYKTLHSFFIMSLQLSSAKVGPLKVNTYVVGTKTQCILIDPSDDSVESKIKINELISGRELLAILFTHVHYDHIMGAHLFDVPCYYQKEDSDFFAFQKEMVKLRLGKELIYPKNISYLKTRMNFGAGDGAVDGDRSVDEDRVVDGARNEDRSVDEGETISFKVIQTPGHTWGSVCFLFERTKKEGGSFLITGDTLFAGTLGRTDVCDKESVLESMRAEKIGVHYDNILARDAIVKSLKKLTELDGALIVYPGHGWSSVLKDEVNWINQL